MLTTMLLPALWVAAAGVEPFHFGGGSVNDLAAAIAKYTGQPCAILMPGSGLYGRDIVVLKEATIVPSPENPRRSLLDGLSKEFGLATDAEELNAFTFGFWPCRVLRPYYTDCTYGPFDAPGPGSITEAEGRKLSIHLRGNEALAVKDMARHLRLDKQFGTHWFYQQLSLVLHARDADRDQLLRLVAATIGGDLAETDLGFEIRFNASAFAKRAAKTYEYFARSIRSLQAKFSFVAEVYKTIPDDLLLEAFRTEHSA